MNVALIENYYRDVLENLQAGVYFTDTHRRITYWNKGAENITGYSSEEVIGSSCMDNLLVHIDGKGNNLCTGKCPLSESIKDGRTREIRIFLHHKDGHRVPVWVRSDPIYDQNETIIGGVEIFSDTSIAISAIDMIDELNKEAYLDELTVVGNRHYCELRLALNFEDFQRSDMPFGVVIADIDHFKQVNDIYGQNIGDKVLQMIANTLSKNLRGQDFIGRWGKDEFLIIQPNTNRNIVEQTTTRLCKLVEHSFNETKSGTIRTSISLGGAMVENEDTPEQIIHIVDECLKQSKHSGRNRSTIAEPRTPTIESIQ